MPTKEIWINLPVKDIRRSKAFFNFLGFFSNDSKGNTQHSACLHIGQKNTVVMLFDEPTFKGFTNIDIANTAKSSEVLLSIDAGSREEVDEIARNVAAAGGVVYNLPAVIQDRMYGCSFTDLDGHRWSVLYMEPIEEEEE